MRMLGTIFNGKQTQIRMLGTILIENKHNENVGNNFKWKTVILLGTKLIEAKMGLLGTFFIKTNTMKMLGTIFNGKQTQ
jgi:hypothetical protein